MQLVTADQVYEICSWDKLMDALTQYHKGEKPLVDSAKMAQKVGDATQSYLNLAAWVPGKMFATKIITVLPSNPDNYENIPSVQAVVTVFDGETGSLRAVIDGTSLTYVKTAADSALGSLLLSREDSSVMTMVGTGALTPFAIKAHLAARPSIKKLNVWGRDPEKAQRVVDGLSDLPANLTVVNDLEAAVRNSDIVSCATSSSDPLIFGDWLQAGTHLDLIGSFTATMRECDDKATSKARLFADAGWAHDRVGEFAIPISIGAMAPDDIEADLFEICSGRYIFDRNDDDITLYKNCGGAHLDLFTADFIARNLKA